jgi:aspartate aminotransferase
MLASRMSRLGTETAFEVLARARALEAKGKEIVHLEIGEPDFDTPENVVEAGVRALKEGHTHYGPSAGLPPAREAVARYVSRTRGIPVEPENVVITPGAKPIIFYTILALVDEGDEVLYPNPGFPIYESVVDFVGAKSVPVPLREERDFAFDVADLEERVSSKTRLLILNSPQNPTGGMLSREDLEKIARLAVENDLFVLADEIYSRILYEGKHESVATFPGMQERTVILDGFSKTYAMTGWRLGYGVMPSELAVQVAKLNTNCASCTASFVQMAGIEALEGPQEVPESMVKEFRARRDLIVEGLNQLPGFRCRTPRGAFYAFPNTEGTGKTSAELETFFLEEAGVATLSGTSFGKFGEGYMRFSYANSQENIRKALEKLSRVLS